MVYQGLRRAPVRCTRAHRGYSQATRLLLEVHMQKLQQGSKGRFTRA